LNINQLPKVEGDFEAKVYDYYSASGVFRGISHSGRKTGAHNDESISPIYCFRMSFGNDEAHQNLQPYQTLYMWERTA
jgi:hypothetical protein